MQQAGLLPEQQQDSKKPKCDARMLHGRECVAFLQESDRSGLVRAVRADIDIAAHQHAVGHGLFGQRLDTINDGDTGITVRRGFLAHVLWLWIGISNTPIQVSHSGGTDKVSNLFLSSTRSTFMMFRILRAAPSLRLCAERFMTLLSCKQQHQRQARATKFTTIRF